MLLRYVAGCSRTDYFVIIVPLNWVQNLNVKLLKKDEKLDKLWYNPFFVKVGRVFVCVCVYTYIFVWMKASSVFPLLIIALHNFDCQAVPVSTCDPPCQHTSMLHYVCLSVSHALMCVPSRIQHPDITTLKGVIIFPRLPPKSDVFTKWQVYSLINQIFCVVRGESWDGRMGGRAGLSVGGGGGGRILSPLAFNFSLILHTVSAAAW